MPYLVTCPPGESVSILKAVGERVTDDGKVIGFEHLNFIRYRAEILDDEDVSPVMRDLLEQPEEGMNAAGVRTAKRMLRKITPTQAKKYRESGAPISQNDDIEVTPDDFDPLVEQVTTKPAGSFGKD